MKLPKRLYLSVFILFFKLGAGQWPAEFNADAHKGAVGVGLIETFLVFAAIFWLKIFTHDYNLLDTKWTAGTIALLIICANYFVLVSKRVGTEFEARFNTFPCGERIAYYALGSSITFLTIFINYLTFLAFHATFPQFHH